MSGPAHIKIDYLELVRTSASAAPRPVPASARRPVAASKSRRSANLTPLGAYMAEQQAASQAAAAASATPAPAAAPVTLAAVPVTKKRGAVKKVNLTPLQAAMNAQLAGGSSAAAPIVSYYPLPVAAPVAAAPVVATPPKKPLGEQQLLGEGTEDNLFPAMRAPKGFRVTKDVDAPAPRVLLGEPVIALTPLLDQMTLADDMPKSVHDMVAAGMPLTHAMYHARFEFEAAAEKIAEERKEVKQSAKKRHRRNWGRRFMSARGRDGKILKKTARSWFNDYILGPIVVRQAALHVPQDDIANDAFDFMPNAADYPERADVFASAPRRTRTRRNKVRISDMARQAIHDMSKPVRAAQMAATVLLASLVPQTLPNVADAVAGLAERASVVGLASTESVDSNLVAVNPVADAAVSENSFHLASGILSLVDLFPGANALVNSSFGNRYHPVMRIDDVFHDGWDIPARTGTRLFAPASGNISYHYEHGRASHLVETPGDVAGMPRSFSGYGRYAVIEFDGALEGFAMRVAHLSAYDAAAMRDGRVEAGQQFALSGASGGVTGPHVHLEMMMLVEAGSPNTLEVDGRHYAPFDAALLQQATQENAEGEPVINAQLLRTLVTAEMPTVMAERAASRLHVERVREQRREARRARLAAAANASAPAVEEPDDDFNPDADFEEQVTVAPIDASLMTGSSLLRVDLGINGPVNLTLAPPSRPEPNALPGALPSAQATVAATTLAPGQAPL